MSDFEPGDPVFDRFTALLEELRFDRLPEDAETPESVREYAAHQSTPECGDGVSPAGCPREPSLRSGDLP